MDNTFMVYMTGSIRPKTAEENEWKERSGATTFLVISSQPGKTWFYQSATIMVWGLDSLEWTDYLSQVADYAQNADKYGGLRWFKPISVDRKVLDSI